MTEDAYLPPRDPATGRFLDDPAVPPVEAVKAASGPEKVVLDRDTFDRMVAALTAFAEITLADEIPDEAHPARNIRAGHIREARAVVAIAKLCDIFVPEDQ